MVRGRESSGICPLLSSVATAMPRSKSAPCFGSSAGERFTVSFCTGNFKPELVMAARTRCSASLQAESGSPIILKPGFWVDTSASISTTDPSSPISAMDEARPTLTT